MQNSEQKSNNDFMIEKLKDRPINRKKLLKKTLTTVSMAILFGLVACLTFQFLEPIIGNWLYPDPTGDPIELFPEDSTEMRPEDMLSDNLPGNSDGFLGEGIIGASNEGGTKSPNGLDLDYLNYVQLYESLASLVEAINKSMVTVTATTVSTDWLENEYETKAETTGVIIGKNGEEALILTDYGSIKTTDNLRVTFWSGNSYAVEIKQYHKESDLAILTLDMDSLGNKAEEIQVVSFGNSSEDLLCMPVIALGRPMGDCGSVGYGMITSDTGMIPAVDANYKFITTDIYGSQNAKGFLFNLKGQIIGIICKGSSTADMRNRITAYGVSDMKNLISTLSGGSQVPYLGVTGISVSQEAHEQAKVPLGVSVQEVEEDSPALKAGLQKGDIIVEIAGNKVESYADYAMVFGQKKANQLLEIKALRQAGNEYTEMTFNIVLGTAK